MTNTLSASEKTEQNKQNKTKKLLSWNHRVIKEQATWEEYKYVLRRICREDKGKVKAQLKLNLSVPVKDNKSL